MTIDELRRKCKALDITPTRPRELVREGDAARLLDRDVRTLRRWRADGDGPPIERKGRSWFYSLAAVSDWMSGNVRLVAADPLPAPSRREHARARPDGQCSLRRRSAA